ncbi:FAD-dependent oxidoreductase [Lactobacillus melliventris]|uniref:FAD-dependent oxidoreductase n=1 Tax=Lactobacillus melliventris TaxID=1218507 RepID=UPI001650A83F|nr:FAD-binding protein [Lactobacillus melliventris]MBC6348703.1 FAD-binding protein [Lactobacillus melliventris]
MNSFSTDVVVVGSGSAGISACFELYQKHVPFVLLEKGNKVGGAGKFGAHGVFAINSTEQKKRHVNYGYREAFNGLTDYNHFFVNGELLARFLKKSGANIDRLAEMGLPVTVEQSEQKAHLNDPLVYHKFNNFKEKMTNWDKLPDKFTAAGNKVMLETAAVDLEYDNGLKAVIAQNKAGAEIRIAAKKVIFADGGYCGSQEMMTANFSDTKALLNLGERKSTGTGIRLTHKLGADCRHRPVLFAHGGAPSMSINPMKRDSAVETLTNLPLLWLDQTANRFVNEDVVYDFAMWGNAAHNVNGIYYVLLDQKTLDTFKQKEVNLEDTFERQFCDVGQTPRTTVGPLPNIQTDFDEAVKTGEVVKADTLEEIAQKLQLPYSSLTRSVNAYNQAVKQKEDDTFLKPAAELLFDVQEGPFYAIIEHCAILGTLDGVNVDRNCQPVKEDGTPLKDLYIVGNNVNGLYSDGYPSYEGIANGFAFVSGWIAAEEAIKSLNQGEK